MNKKRTLQRRPRKPEKPAETTGDHPLKSPLRHVKAVWSERPLWGVLAAIHMTLDLLTVSGFVFEAAGAIFPRISRQRQLLAPDIYSATVTISAYLVLFSDVHSLLSLQAILALIRIEEIVVIWIGIIVRLWWWRDWTIYGVLFHAVQVSALLAIATRGLASHSFLNNQSQAPRSPINYFYMAVTNMTTRGNEYTPTDTGGELLVMLSALIGLLLFGAVLSSLVPPARASGDA